jgi:hypothetical protein
MKKTPAEVVREGLKAYADRGIFRSFAEKKGKDGKIRFAFLLFENEPMNLEFTEKEHTLVMRNMLKQVPADMYSDLQDFLKKLYDRDLPSHRRLNRSSADVHFKKWGGNVSLVYKVKRNRYKHGVQQLISLAGWINYHLHKYHPDYVWEVIQEEEG